MKDEDGQLFRNVPLHPELAEAFDEAGAEFRKVHGRDPRPDDLIFGDMGHQEYVEAEMVDTMKKAGIDPALIYAFEKTGLIVTEMNQDKMPDSYLQEWREAVEEYEDRVAEGDDS